MLDRRAIEYDVAERIAIMVHDGGVDPREAAKPAHERPWEMDPHWRLPQPVQMEMDLGREGFQARMRQLWTDY